MSRIKKGMEDADTFLKTFCSPLHRVLERDPPPPSEVGVPNADELSFGPPSAAPFDLSGLFCVVESSCRGR